MNATLYAPEPTLARAWPHDCGDRGGNVFGGALRALQPDIPHDAFVLVVGGAEFDWLTPASAAWPLMEFVGIDTRPTYWLDGPTVQRVHGDALTHHFPSGWYDWIVAIHTLEHLDLAHDGDTRLLQRAYDWLRPGGWLYCDVPVSQQPYHVQDMRRVYSELSLRWRLIGERPWIVEGVRCVRATGQPFDTCALWLRKPNG